MRLGALRARAAVVLAGVVLLAATAVAAQEGERFKGRALADALAMLQTRGLRIVFTSAIVSPDLRVRSEPRAATARKQLEELLAPHGLEAREGPGGTIQIVRAKRVTSTPAVVPAGTIRGRVIDALSAAPLSGVVVRMEGASSTARTDAEGRFRLTNLQAGTYTLLASAPGYAPAVRAVDLTGALRIDVTVELTPTASTHNEYVTVSRPFPLRRDRGAASEMNVARGELGEMYGSLADDPVRAVHAMPRVVPVDEARTEFAVRGSPFRHVDFVVDGVSTEWLRHTAYDRGATGSLAMVAGQVVEDATLRAGAFPRRHGDRLGAQLELTIREGSRAGFRIGGAVSGTSATLLGEGPLGSSARGSWLVAVRQSYVEWPTGRADAGRTPFGFADGLAKLVFDAGATQRLTLSVIGGMTNVDAPDELPAYELGEGTNRVAVMNLSWRSTLRSGLVVSQRAYVVRQHFLNAYQTGERGDSGTNDDFVYRVDVVRPAGGGLLEAGARLERTTVDLHPRTTDLSELAAWAWQRSAYAHLAWPLTSTVTVSPGVRIGSSTLAPAEAVAPWLLGEWTIARDWVLSGSIGASQQLPEPRQVLGRAEPRGLRPERAIHADLAIERRLTNVTRWQAMVFSRAERDVLREPDSHPRLVDGTLVPAEPRYANALEGTARGIELLVERRGPTGPVGWAAYTYGKTRYIDRARGETFWADFDQRHAVTLFGAYPLSPRTSVGLTFRAGTSVPLPGYLAAQDGRLVLGDRRNQVRLPAYARLDVRADRRFDRLGPRLTLFGEVLNVLNRPNVGLANGSIDASTGAAVGFTDAPFRRRASAGLHIEL